MPYLAQRLRKVGLFRRLAIFIWDLKVAQTISWDLFKNHKAPGFGFLFLIVHQAQISSVVMRFKSYLTYEYNINKAAFNRSDESIIKQSHYISVHHHKNTKILICYLNIIA